MNVDLWSKSRSDTMCKTLISNLINARVFKCRRILLYHKSGRTKCLSLSGEGLEWKSKTHKK